MANAITIIHTQVYMIHLYLFQIDIRTYVKMCLFVFNNFQFYKNGLLNMCLQKYIL